MTDLEGRASLAPERHDHWIERFESLSTEECLVHLANNAIGRLAVNNGGQPEIFPVNYGMDADRVVIRTAEGTKLRHASLDRVAFEIEGEIAGEPWSVVVKGTAREISTALDDASVRERTLPLEAPAPLGEDPHWLRIIPHEITGRRIAKAEV
ncbi:MAG: pyridoxamine 5'-phosphate oxidase family protein [Actinomycetota bacterium]|jgi:nitroimidazol reductase NimA-like FMN-containing flavoprotein (pyridoxamine 5'-phosphate oxidase superfamily)|nr:pyridoxamine 5'-phosphate oxidase family protein [Actinomycetota bacterium]